MASCENSTIGVVLLVALPVQQHAAGQGVPLRVKKQPCIDELLQAAWKENRIEPAGKVGDAEFMRVYLDIIG